MVVWDVLGALELGDDAALELAQDRCPPGGHPGPPQVGPRQGAFRHDALHVEPHELGEVARYFEEPFVGDPARSGLLQERPGKRLESLAIHRATPRAATGTPLGARLALSGGGFFRFSSFRFSSPTDVTAIREDLLSGPLLTAVRWCEPYGPCYITARGGAQGSW